MIGKIMRWVPITALLLAVAWRPSVNSQILLHFVVCAVAAMILALVFIRQNRDSPRGQAESTLGHERGGRERHRQRKRYTNV
jgi:sugar phosphate permease